MSSIRSSLGPSVRRKIDAFIEELANFKVPLHGRELDAQLTFSAMHMRWAHGLKPGNVVLVDSPREAHEVFSARYGIEDNLNALKKSGSRFMSHYGQVLSSSLNRSWSHQKYEEARVRVEEKLSKLTMFEVARLSELEINSQQIGYAPVHVLISQKSFYIETILAAFAKATDEGVSQSEGTIRLLLMSPCVLMYREDLIVSRPPVKIITDILGRLHAEDGPAVRFTNGDQISSIAGIHVSNSIFNPGSKLNAHLVINERNLEVRRVLMERLGIESILKQLKAKEIAVDDYGTLFQAVIPEQTLYRYYHWQDFDDNQVAFVKLLNSTPEPDGSFKEYLLRVPPDMKTPREAVAWSFDMNEADYAPSVQT